MTAEKKRKRTTRKPAVKDSGRPDYCSIARKMCEKGATRSDLAEAFNVTSTMIDRWLAENPEFADSCAVGNERANERVTRSLYERAVGYSYDAEKLFISNGIPVRATYKVQVPPDPKAAVFWLKHRAWQKWPDDPTEQETGETPLQALFRQLEGTGLRPRELPPNEPPEIQNIENNGEQDEP